MEQEDLEKAARTFLKTGTISNLSEQDLATACDRLIQSAAQRSLRNALRLANRFRECAQPHSTGLRLSAARVFARISHLSGQHRVALPAYLAARKLAHKDLMTRARIDRALIDVYMYLGDLKASEQAARRSARIFRAAKATGDLAQTQVNYGNLLHRQDRHREAEKIYRQAAEYFETTENKTALARCYYNLANSLLQLFRVGEAEVKYLSARQLWEAAGYELDACDARYGLAWLYLLTGRLHTALDELTFCEHTYHRAGDPRGEALCKLDRAEVYLHLGLVEDARQTALSAEKQFSKLGLRYEHAKSMLFRAQAALPLGRHAESRSCLTKARREFAREKNDGFLAVVSLTEADVCGVSTSTGRRRMDEARTRFRRSHLPFWQAVCDLRDTSVPQRLTAASSRLRTNRAAQCVPHIYAMWQTLEGDRAMLRNRTGAARLFWKRAADRLDAVRAQLPPVELRTAYARDLSSPHRRLIDLELDRDPLLSAVWSERLKTAGVWATLPFDGSHMRERRKVEESLQTLASHYSHIAHQLSAGGPSRETATQERTRAISRLQRMVREELIRVEETAAASPESLELLGQKIGSLSLRIPILQFHLQDSDIVAFIHEGGRTRVRQFENGRSRLIADLERWRFILEGELLPDYRPPQATCKAEQALWEHLATWLWAPLEINSTWRNILIVAEGELANLPWEALRTPSGVLGDRHCFIQAPSIRHYAAARSRRPVGRTVQIFRGAGDSLKHVDQELRTLHHLAGTDAELYSPASRTDWPMSGDMRLWHFSGHAVMREDNPFYSNLPLADGPLFAVDFRVRQCRVGLATLAACRAGEQVALPGEESTGLVRSLLEMGARNVIAGRWPVSDHTAALWMNAFYHSFFENSDIMNAATAAAKCVRQKFPSAFHWAAFATFGAGDMGDLYEAA